MNQHKISPQVSNLNQLVFKIYFLLTLISIFIILIATLYPLNFSFPANFSLQTFITSFDNTSFLTDQIDNILLFTPLGFCLTGFLQRTRMKLISFFTVILISACLSTSIECLQVFLPSRTSTPEDIFNNTIGGFVGIICFYLWKPQDIFHGLTRIENSKASKSVKKIMLFFIGYILLSFLLSSLWQNTTNLSNWNLNDPLIIGNEKTGNRPWHGSVSEVYITDREISKNQVGQVFSNKSYLNKLGNSLLYSYEFTGIKSSNALTENFPKLIPQGQLSNVQDEKGAALSSNHWLKTAVPVTSLSKRIRETSQFTISTTAATADTAQTGPARIISISSNPTHRNFTLGQQGTNLDLRLRTPITGANGTDLNLTIPGIFTDTNLHHIVITYSRATLQVYVDKLQNSYSLNLLELIPTQQKIYYYALTFIPLGICLTLITSLAKRKLRFYRLLLPSGILLPSLILESILVSESGKSISLRNLLLGIFFTSATLLLVKVRTCKR